MKIHHNFGSADMKSWNDLHDRKLSMFMTSGKSAGVTIVSTFSNIKMPKMHDVIDSARPNHPISKPVVYKSKQKNFRTKAIVSRNWSRVAFKLIGCFYSLKIPVTAIFLATQNAAHFETNINKWNCIRFTFNYVIKGHKCHLIDKFIRPIESLFDIETMGKKKTLKKNMYRYEPRFIWIYINDFWFFFSSAAREIL